MSDQEHFVRVLKTLQEHDARRTQECEQAFTKALLAVDPLTAAQKVLFEWELRLNVMEHERVRAKKVLNEMFLIKKKNANRWKDEQEQWLDHVVTLSSHMEYRYVQDTQRITQLQQQLDQMDRNDDMVVFLNQFLDKQS